VSAWSAFTCQLDRPLCLFPYRRWVSLNRRPLKRSRLGGDPMSMPSANTSGPPSPPKQPSFWYQYSPRGECPLSFSASGVVHVVLLAVVIFGALWGILSATRGNTKPVQIDVVEIEGLGGGLGGNSVGPGLNNTGNPGRREGGAKPGPGEKR